MAGTLPFSPAQSAKALTAFLRETYQKAGKARAVIAVSGGIDSAVSLTLLVQALGSDAVFPIFLPYHGQNMEDAHLIAEWNEIPQQNQQEIPIGPAADQLRQILRIDAVDTVRFGNVMARIRMIAVFDTAKKLEALVCGTENKSEHYLGYFTRFGDGASDVEPIIGLYKMQVRRLAEHLGLPEQFLEKTPSAGLWEGQTDESELGFSYEEADAVLEQLVDQHKSPEEIDSADQEIVRRVVARVRQTAFKHAVPYTPVQQKNSATIR